MEQIPFVAHESAMHRMEKTNKRMWILCLVLIAALILSNAAWVIYESQFETVTETTEETYTYDVEQEGDGGVSFVGRNNINGKTENTGNN